MGTDAGGTVWMVVRWTIGYTLEQRLRFFRGVMLGFLASVILFGAAFGTTFAVRKSWKCIAEEACAKEVFIMSGYSSCCMDVMAIISNGGGVDEVIGFARAKGAAEFSPSVSPADFYSSSAEGVGK